MSDEQRTAESVRQWLRYLFPGELAYLKELARSLPPNPTIINIGAGGGTSGLAFMEAREDVDLVTIDIQDESSPTGCLAAERQVFKEAGYPREGQFWRQVHIDSKLFRWDKMADLVLIDGDHSYLGCASDIAVWSPRIKPGGILAIHDFEKESIAAERYRSEGPHPMAWPGVNRAVGEYIRSGDYSWFKIVETLIVFSVLSPAYEFSFDLEALSKLEPGQPCSHGCAGHVTHACEICGRVAMGILK